MADPRRAEDTDIEDDVEDDVEAHVHGARPEAKSDDTGEIGDVEGHVYVPPEHHFRDS